MDASFLTYDERDAMEMHLRETYWSGEDMFLLMLCDEVEHQWTEMIGANDDKFVIKVDRPEEWVQFLYNDKCKKDYIELNT